MSAPNTPPGTPSARRKSTIAKPSPSPLRPGSPAGATPKPSNVVAVGSSTSASGRLTPDNAAAPARRPTISSPPSKTRARDLLRKHYGLGVGPPAPLPGKPMDPMSLDSPAFDAKSYYEQLITTSSLPMLLKRENDLLNEIRELDSERQSLVYNHHHELIAASDTIAAVKTRTESLDADLELLKAAFSEISRLAMEVSVENPADDS